MIYKDRYGQLGKVTRDGKTDMFKTRCDPDHPVVNVSLYERTLGRLLRATTVHEPKTGAMIDLVGDSFHALYRPEVTTVEEPRSDRAVNKILLDWTTSLPDFEESKNNTVGNLPAALAAAGILWESLTTEEALQDALKAQEKAEELEEQADQHYMNAAKAQEKGDNQTAQQEIQKAEQARQEAQEAVAQGVEQIEKMMDNPLAQGMIQEAAQKAGEGAEDMNIMMKGWGIEPGEISYEDTDEVLKLAAMNQGRLRDVAEMIGRMKGIAARSIENVRMSYTGAVSEPQFTDDITRLFPIQRAYLSKSAPPYVRAQSLSQLYGGGGMLGWKPKFEGKRQGSFVCMVDRSLSMSDGDLTIAKGVAIGIAKALVDDNTVIDRKYRLTFFQSVVDKGLTVTSEDDWREHVEWASVASAGGTDFDEALEYACDQIYKFGEQGVHGADILFITDDYCRANSKTLELVKKTHEATGARLLVVKIVGGDGYGGSDTGSLDEVASMIIEIKSGIATGVADDIVNQIVTDIIKSE